MILYHGSNIKVDKPKIMPPKRMLDFGRGFYLTSDLEQAKRWAARTEKIRNDGKATVSIFNIDSDCINSLNILRFESADRQWLRFVSQNRMSMNFDENNTFDIIIGPVADDQVIRTVNQYMKGYFSEDIAVQLLLPQRFKDQYAFKTEKALNTLIFLEEMTL
ncbi:MAG: DUF3990 domain-containing protein [Oscillospiraceae bacterium]|nr:DUF3990 domain-containing protein [Oscillospiraceae bacterium]